MADIILRNPQFLGALPVIWLLFVIVAWRRRFKPFGAFLLRLLIVVLVILALSQPVIPTLDEAGAAILQQRVVFLVDQSASLTPGEQQRLQTEAARLAQEIPDSEILYFADQPVVPPPAGIAAAREAETLPLDPELTNLAAALSMGAELFSGRSGRLVLLSDGRPTAGHLDEALNTLVQNDIPVDVLILDDAAREPTNDVQILDLSAPQVLREGEIFTLDLTLHAAVAAPVKLELLQEMTPLAESVISLDPGLNHFSYEAEAGAVGFHTFRANIAPVEMEDVQPANNTFSAFAQVYPQPQVLLVSDESTSLSRLAAQLEQAGFTADTLPPGQLPERLSDLEPYDGMMMLDVTARTLELEQMLAVQEFVRSLGRGLTVVGGRSSFSLGEYEDTPLADILPLSLEPPPREERPPVALLLIIDHSGSMGEAREPATSLDMAKEAAIRATEILGPDDLIGILMFDNRYEWVIPFEQAQDGAALLAIQSKIATIPPGGGTRILPALETGLLGLAEQETFDGPRHAVLFSDGKSFDGDKGVDAYNALVDFALESDITLSTIAIGDEADRELLSHLAERGQGRYHDAAVPDDLPALTIAESDILRSDAVQEGDYGPAIAAPHPIVRGFAVFTPGDCAEAPCLQEAAGLEWPPLTGYIAMTPKPRAEVALQVGSEDPLLAVWGYGLGRVAAWSSDAGSEWAQAWNSWPELSRFWGQVVGYTLPAPNLGLLQVDVELDPTGVATLIADGVTATGQTVDLARTEATLLTPGGREAPLTLRQVGPGRYQQKVQLADPGAYRLTVTQTRGGESEATAAVGFVMPYPAEYALPPADETGGQTLLRKIAATTGGRTFSLGRSLLEIDCAPQEENCEPPDPPATDRSPAVTEPVTGLDLWPWLMLAALLLWPVEIGLRRLGRLRIQ